MHAAAAKLVAVDIGNSRIKLGLFEQADPGDRLPHPARVLELPSQGSDFSPLEAWLAAGEASAAWVMGSVNRAAATRLIEWLRQRDADVELRLLGASDLPLAVEVPRPDMVGIDRLLAAVGANRIRSPERPAAVVDLGSAITVDLLSPAGAFVGGAILPGIGLSARALHEFTDLLPLLEMHALDAAPEPLGTATAEAMRAGLFWGAVGGVRELVRLYAARHPAEPELFLTGGAAPSVAALLGQRSAFEPNLVLAGIAITAAAMNG